MKTSVLLLALLPAACAAPPVDSSQPREAVERVLAADEQAGTRRNHAPESGSVAGAVRAYVAELDALDLSHCPTDFREALRAHREAWAASIPYLESFPDERGEMHDVFDRLTADSNPTGDVLRAHIDAIWATWGDVERAVEALDARGG